MISINKKLKIKSTITLNNKLKLDTAGEIFPLAFSKGYKSLARIDIVMRDNINKENLQKALNNLFLRFPTFFVRLRNDRFHYFFEALDKAPEIIEENGKIFSTTMNDLYLCAFKIFIFENNLALEFFHAISDGYGANIFLRTLLAEYIRIEYGVTCAYETTILNPFEESKLSETSNDFLKYTTNATRIKEMSPTYTVKGIKDHNVYVSEFIYKTDELISYARKYGVSFTSLISALLLRSLSHLQSQKKANKSEIKLSIPVDLRRQFPSNTLRNFSISTTIKAGQTPKKLDFEILCKKLDKQIKSNLDKENLKQMVTTYVKLASNKMLSILPLFLKKTGVRLFYALMKNGATMTLTNLGSISYPECLKPYIQKNSFILSPKPSTPYTCSVVSFNNISTITLTRSIKEDLLESHFKQEIKTLFANQLHEGSR